MRDKSLGHDGVTRDIFKVWILELTMDGARVSRCMKMTNGAMQRRLAPWFVSMLDVSLVGKVYA